METALITLTDPKKHRCGDHCTVRNIQDEHLLVVCAADGIGSFAKDWLASQISCQSFISNFCDMTIQPIEKRIIHAIEKANEELLDACAGTSASMATLVVVVWDYAGHRVYYVSIGDSRIYAINQAGNLDQLTIDDSKAVIARHRDGKPALSGGVLAIRTGVTNAVGSGPLTIDVQEISAKEIFTLVLATDGFYTCAAFSASTLMEIAESFNLQKALDRKSVFFKDSQEDDCTAVLVRNTHIPETVQKDIQTAVLNGKPWEEHGTVSRYNSCLVIHDMLLKAITDKNRKNFETIITLIEANSYDFGRDALHKLISQAVKIGFTDSIIINRLVGLMRVSDG